MSDPLLRLARERAMGRRIANSADMEIQFSSVPGARPIVTMLRRARDEAAEAMVALAVADAEEPKLIRQLQNCVLLFDNLVRLARDVINDGKQADEDMTEAERDELLDYLLATDEGRQEAEALGLVDKDVTDA